MHNFLHEAAHRQRMTERMTDKPTWWHNLHLGRDSAGLCKPRPTYQRMVL